MTRGARARDRQILVLLDPIAQKLEGDATVLPEEVAAIAQLPHARALLHQMLDHYRRLDLFPDRFNDPKHQAEAQLAYWLMHPNELQAAPEQMEMVEVVGRSAGNKNGDFYVYRYRMSEGHWAASDGWLLGLAGPYFDGEEPYMGRAGAFSRVGDKHGEISPAELVDWYVAMATQKGILPLGSLE